MSSPIGIVWYVPASEAAEASVDRSRFADFAKALAERGATPIGIPYCDENAPKAKDALLHVKAAQVWVNPIAEGRDRRVLDSLLRDVSSKGVQVFTHPETILKMGTKQVLYDTRNMSWGSDVRMYPTVETLRTGLTESLALGKPRILKQHRGHSGIGIWKVERAGELLKVRHAPQGSPQETMTLDEFVGRCVGYFTDGGCMYDQEYQDRIVDGMIRVYLVEDRVAGFGHQAVVALYPPVDGDPSEATPKVTTRFYHPPDTTEFQPIKEMMEQVWVPELLDTLKMNRSELPLLWDADFFNGPDGGSSPYVLCEINVSCVSPYPESATPMLADAILRRANESLANDVCS